MSAPVSQYITLSFYPPSVQMFVLYICFANSFTGVIFPGKKYIPEPSTLFGLYGFRILTTF